MVSQVVLWCWTVVLSVTHGHWLLPSFDAQGSRLFPASPSNSTLGCASGGADVIRTWPTANNNQGIDWREVEMSPLIDDHAVYVISADNKNVSALDPLRWTLLWSVDVAGNTSNKVLSPLSLQGGLLYLMVGKIGGRANVLLALRSTDGSRVWGTPEETEYSLRPSTVVPLPDGSVLTYGVLNETAYLLSVRPSNSSHFGDYIVWSFPFAPSLFPDYIMAPLLSADKENIFFFQGSTLYYLSSQGTLLHKMTISSDTLFGGRLFLREDKVAVLVFIDTNGTDVFYHSILFDVFHNVTTSYPHIRILCLAPDQTLVYQNSTQLVRSTYNMSQIWTQSLKPHSGAAGSVDSNGILYIASFQSGNVGSYMAAYRLSDGKQYWSGNADTPLQWSMSHFQGEYLLLLQSRGSMGRVSNQNHCSPTGATCTEDGCKCKPHYFGPGCFTFCDNTLNCSDYGTCDDHGHCKFFCDNTTFCNNRASLCVNATCTCQYNFWAFHTYSGERCEVEALNIPFIGTIGGVSFAVVLLLLLIAISACRKKDYESLN